jgi:drug/metabolite transporter (DMT)-like permease
MALIGIYAILGWVVLESIRPGWNRYLMTSRRAFGELELLAPSFLIGGIVAGALCLTFFPAWENVNAGRANETVFWLSLAGTTVVNVGIQYFNIRAFAVADVSYVKPIQGVTPGLVTLTAIMLGEIPTPIGWAGIVLVSAGVYIHMREGATLREFFNPLFVWRAFGSLEGLDEKERMKRIGLKYAWGSALLGTIGLVCDGLLVRYGNPALGLSIEWGMLGVVYALFLLFGIGRRGNELGPYWSRLKRHVPHIVGLGVLSGLAPIILAFAFIEAPIAYVGTLKRLAIVGAVLVAIFFFGEARRPEQRGILFRRVACVMIIVLGAILIGYDPGQSEIVRRAGEALEQLP